VVLEDLKKTTRKILRNTIKTGDTPNTGPGVSSFTMQQTALMLSCTAFKASSTLAYS
jgi:hypothetical protein